MSQIKHFSDSLNGLKNMPIAGQVSLNGVCWGPQGGKTPRPMCSGYKVSQVLLVAVADPENPYCTSTIRKTAAGGLDGNQRLGK